MSNGFEKITQQQYLKDRGITVEQVQECFNCNFAEIDDEGEIWIEGPQTGHWLKDGELDQFVKFVEARD